MCVNVLICANIDSFIVKELPPSLLPPCINYEPEIFFPQLTNPRLVTIGKLKDQICAPFMFSLLCLCILCTLFFYFSQQRCHSVIQTHT
jgi:hypothetical protein